MKTHGNAVWTPQKLAFTGVLMAWAEQDELTQRFDHICEFLEKSKRHWSLGASYRSWVAAQQRELDRLLPLIVQRLRKFILQLSGTLKNRRRKHRLKRWEAFAVDGSKIACPRTIENQQAMGDLGKPDGIPQMSLTAVLHLRTGLPWDFRVGPGTDSERGHLRAMLNDLPADSILAADAGFIGYDLAREMIDRQQPFLFRVGGNTHLLTTLGYDHEVAGETVYLWPELKRREGLEPIQLRLIVLQKQGQKPVVVVTNVLDDTRLTHQEAAEIYELRWGVEVFFRTIKQTLGHHTMRSRTPQTCYLEASWAFVGAWLLELMTVDQIVSAGGFPEKVSPAQARNAVRRVMRGSSPRRQTTRSLCDELCHCQTDNYNRRGRKSTRPYPRKKHPKPPGPPNIKPPTELQLKQAQRLTPIIMPI